MVGTLAAGITSIVNPVAQFQKANDAKRKSDLSQIQGALEVFYQDNGRYPEAVNNKIKRSDGIGCSGDECAADWGSSLWSPYMSILPKDPSSSRNYIYCSPLSSTGQSYYLYASLEREGNNPSNFLSAGCLETSCGVGLCNYGISSQNVSP